jgi:hypothetical protein
MIDYLLGVLIVAAIVIVTIYLIKTKRASGGCASGCAGCSKAGQCSAFSDIASLDRKIGKPGTDSIEKSVDGKLHL